MPPVTATAVTVTGEVAEVFVKVTVPVPVFAPVGKVIVRGLGVTVTVPRGTPVPLSATGDPVTAALPAMVSVPVTAPLADGVNTDVDRAGSSDCQRDSASAARCSRRTGEAR